jgi:transposase
MGALTRCDPPSARRQCLGLIPAEESPGARRQPGAMTQAGTPQARRALGDGAWASRDPATLRRQLPRRREPPPNSIQELSGKAQGRQGQRSRHLSARGQQAHGVTGAMARALVGFMGAMAHEMPVTPSGQDS